jgi:hypothetical protein
VQEVGEGHAHYLGATVKRWSEREKREREREREGKQKRKG